MMELVNKMKPILFLVFFAIIVNLGGYIMRKIEKENIYKKEIKGIISEIRERRGGNNYFYDSKEYFTDDDFFEERYTTDVKVGDSIFKKSNSKILYIHRKEKGKYILIKKGNLYTRE